MKDKRKYIKQLVENDFKQICILTTEKEMIAYFGLDLHDEHVLLVLSDKTEITLFNDFFISFNNVFGSATIFDKNKYFQYMYQKFGEEFLKEKIDYELEISKKEEELITLKEKAISQFQKEMELYSS